MAVAELQAALNEFTRACAEDRSPDFARFDLAIWARAADGLVEGGELQLAAFAVHQLRAQWPTFAWARNVQRLFELMPPPDPAAPPFADAFPAAMQVVERPGAETAMLVFCGAKHRIGMPLPMMHRWLSRWPVNLIYLRDLKSLGYMAGIEGLGPDLDGALGALQGEIQKLGARRVVCYGHSLGGYGALRYGLELGAEAVVLLSGVVNLDPAFNAGLHYAGAARRLRAAFPDEVLDLKQPYLGSARPPAVYAVYAEHNWDDRIQAEHLADLDGVVTIETAGSKTHNTAVELMRAGRFDDLISDAVGARVPAD